MFLGKYFADFEIPEDMTSLWKYMDNMYHLDAFTQSCPADQDIINLYKHQQVPLYFYNLVANSHKLNRSIFHDLVIRVETAYTREVSGDHSSSDLLLRVHF